MNAWDLQRRRGRQNDNQATGVLARDQPNLTESSQYACANNASGAVWPCHSEQNSLEVKKGTPSTDAIAPATSNTCALAYGIPLTDIGGKAKLSAHTSSADLWGNRGWPGTMTCRALPHPAGEEAHQAGASTGSSQPLQPTHVVITGPQARRVQQFR